MTIPFSGKCACGRIRYMARREPIAMLNCHCKDCQLSSGAPFASGVVVMTADLEISGTPKTYAVNASSGGLATRSFCGDCGTPLFTQSEANAQFTSIRFPTLDDASAFKPMLESIPQAHNTGFALTRQFRISHSRLSRQKSQKHDLLVQRWGVRTSTRADNTQFMPACAATVRPTPGRP